MALFGAGYKKKVEELKRQLDEQNFEAAALTADEIPLKKVKSAHELNLIGKAYKCNGDYLQAKEAFVRSYEIRCSRPALIDIMDCCLEVKDLENAEKYFDEYHKVAPDDKVIQYKYRYRIEKRKGRERRLLITILEELKALDYMEEFAYELAKQYHKAGMAEECMRECNDIILWFGFGPTVERAKTLLAYYKGEISLDDIKSAGAKYQAEQKPEPLETPAWAEAVRPEEIKEEVKEEIIEEKEEPVQEAAVTEEPEDFIMPEIDLSGISFEEETNKATDDSRREEELYFVPEEEPVELIDEKLAELLKNKQVSLPEILKNFGRTERIRKQIVKSLELALADREKAYFVITGETQTGKTTLALSFIHLLYRLGMIKYDRTATIDAVQLNQVSIEDYGNELKNCNLIIENAGGMTKESVEGLLRFSKGNGGKTCVILEDSVRSMNKFLRAREELNSLFNNRIHLGKYNAEELMGFAYDYIKKEDYGIDKTAAQVLRKNMDEIVTKYSNDQRLMEALKLAKSVVANAEKRTGELILSMAQEGKIRQGNYLVVLPEDITS